MIEPAERLSQSVSRDVVHEVFSERYSMLSTRVHMGVLIVGHLGERRARRIGKNAKPCFVKTDWIVVIHSRLKSTSLLYVK